MPFRAASAVVPVDRQASATLSAPVGTLATDIVLACFHQHNATSAITPPAGWTSVWEQAEPVRGNGGTEVFLALGNVASFLFTTDAGAAYVAFTLAYSGIDLGTPQDVSATGQNNISGTTDTGSSITTVTDNAIYVYIFGHNENATFTDGGGLTHRQSGGFSPPTIQNIALDAADGIQTPIGATGTHTTLASVAGSSEVVTMVLRSGTNATGGWSLYRPYTLGASIAGLGSGLLYYWRRRKQEKPDE